MTESAEQLILSEVRGHTGFILLNRPKAINALNVDMIGQMHAILKEWASDDAVRQVAVHGAGERGLCAGGDIVALHKTAGRIEDTRAFFTAEYALDHFISEYPKPYVALMDGLTLGGGVGISAHGSVRVVTERTRLGMPETGIGFIPDVGATRLLSNVPGELGTYMALTGAMVSGADAMHLGLADAYVPSERLGELLLALEQEDADDVVARLRTEPPASELAGKSEWIDAAFSSDSPLSILASLRGELPGGEESADERAEIAETIESKSPTATFVTLELLRRNKDKTLREALDEELRVGVNIFAAGEMVEGIRAQVIDKDKSPTWNPAALEDVTPRRVAEILGDTVPAAR